MRIFGGSLGGFMVLWQDLFFWREMFDDEIERVLRTQIANSFEIVLSRLPPEKREGNTGGYFVVFLRRGRTGTKFRRYFLMRVGTVATEEEWAHFFHYGHEKAERLVAHRCREKSSWLSRDPQSGMYGGAIIAGDFILSFSGLPELADEAVMLHAAVMLELITRRAARRIALRSSNHYFLDLESTAFHRPATA